MASKKHLISKEIFLYICDQRFENNCTYNFVVISLELMVQLYAYRIAYLYETKT